MFRKLLASARTTLAWHIALAVLATSLVALPAAAGTATARADRDHAHGDAAHGDRGQGGNSTAVAVNTTDHALVFKLTFAILKVTSDIVDNQNIAVAYASCDNCQTVAISIQTLLVDSAASVVAPINEAVSRNQNCDQCDTVAIAYQFVIAAGTKLKFTPEGRREIAYIRRQLERLRDDARRTGMTGAQVVVAVAALMKQYAGILNTQLGAASQPGDRGNQADTSDTTAAAATSPTSPPTDQRTTPTTTTGTTPTTTTGTTPTTTTATTPTTTTATTPTTTTATTPTTTTATTPTTTTATTPTTTTTSSSTTSTTTP